MNTGKALLGVLAGIAAGAVLGMLFAPEKGTATRKKIARKGEDLADELNERIDQKFTKLLKTIAGKLGKPKTENDFVGIDKMKKSAVTE